MSKRHNYNDAFCTNHRIKNYTINKDGMIDVNGNVTIQIRVPAEDESEMVLPVQFGHVRGDFDASWTELTSLVGMPFLVCGSINLIFCPITINDENFDILYRYDYNQLILSSELDGLYTDYYRTRKRTESINDLLE
jgi:hypothetical protein